MTRIALLLAVFALALSAPVFAASPKDDCICPTQHCNTVEMGPGLKITEWAGK